MATLTASQRAEMTAQIDRLADAGMDVRELRADLAKLRLPDDTMIVTVSHADAIIGAAQLRSIVKLLGDRMPTEAIALLDRLSTALLAAEVKP